MPPAYTGWAIGTNTYRSVTYDFLLTIRSNHGPISHRFRDKRCISVEIANFSHPSVFSALAERIPFEFGTDASGGKTRMMVLPDGRKRSCKIDLAV